MLWYTVPAMELTMVKRARTAPDLPYREIAARVLGKNYELSLVFVGEAKARQLNKAYRNAEYIPNVLSFPLDDTHGEIYISPVRAVKEAPKWNMTSRSYIGFLFIHGLLHLKGHHHGATMENEEKRLLTLFSLQH